ncbi:MAG: outer membrane beta-barrel protein [Candidatus Electrothrix aestuarii]|uniref:Outer membrane beta-barrel protein n=1 Tax=Candidatus Electrothrix aestuarii TaxID=3062594 RepID=A0AAU8LSW9_9BACT
MKKILSAAALSALMFTAAPGMAGNMKIMPPSLGADCPADCQDQIDQLNSSQARQDEQLQALEESQVRQDQAIDANAADIKTNLEEIEKLKNHEAYNPWYVKATLQLTWMGSMDLDKEEYGFQADADTGYGFGISAGRQFDNFRIEGELGGRTADIKAEGLSDITITTAMLNGFYGVPVYGPFSVYGTAGAGTAKVEMAFANGDDSEVTFAYKAGAGVAMDIARNMAVDLGYEYLRTGDVEFGRDHEMLRVDDLKSSALNASLRYSF